MPRHSKKGRAVSLAKGFESRQGGEAIRGVNAAECHAGWALIAPAKCGTAIEERQEKRASKRDALFDSRHCTRRGQTLTCRPRLCGGLSGLAVQPRIAR